MGANYTIIVKVGYKNGVLQGREGFMKFRKVTNLIRFTKFMDTSYPDWRFFNVYDKKTRAELKRFTKNSRPMAAKLRPFS